MWGLPLDHDGKRWISRPWKLPAGQRQLIGTEGPAGLRLPLHQLPDTAMKRALVLEQNGSETTLFFPPLLQAPFARLLEIVAPLVCAPQPGRFRFEGYIPGDDAGLWSTLSFTPDPGVLEINLPPCATVSEYAWWLERLHECAEAAGLRSFKSAPHAEWGTGGGNHLLFGGPTLGGECLFPPSALGHGHPALLAAAPLPFLSFHRAATSAPPPRRPVRMNRPATITTWRWPTAFWSRSRRMKTIVI